MMLGFYFEAAGLLVVEEQGALSPMDVFIALVPMVLIGLLLRNAMNSLFGAVERARENEGALLVAVDELQATRESLEERVTERTLELQRRSAYLEAAAEVSRAASSILETERLTWRVTELIRQRFNLYHVGLFQVDESGEWAEYRAGAGPGSQELLADGFRLQVGGESMVGWCTAKGRQRVAQDVTTETMRVDHPLVPDTRSEAVLPLIVHGWVAGALNVQSDRPHAFDADTLAALQTIADQVAVALDNARLFSETEAALEAERRAYGEITHHAWAQLVQARPDWGYLCGLRGTVGPAPSRWQPEMLRVAETGQTIQTDDLSVTIPVKIQDHTTGVVRLRKRDGSVPWTGEEIELMQSLAEQLGVTLESARLHQDAQRRAVREQLVAQISAEVRASLDPDTILKTSVRELGHVLGAERAAIEITGPQVSNGGFAEDSED
jgi:GAF domain-containing protein